MPNWGFHHGRSMHRPCGAFHLCLFLAAQTLFALLALTARHWGTLRDTEGHWGTLRDIEGHWETEPESVGMEQRAVFRTAGIDIHAGCTHDPHEHSRGPRCKECVNLHMAESLTLFFPSVFVCALDVVRAGVLVRVHRAVERDWREENFPAKTLSVNYLLIQFGRWLPKKSRGQLGAQLKRRERGDNLLLKSPPDFHLCLTKCLLPIPGLWAMPGCTASLSLPSYRTPFSSVLLSFHIACFHSTLHI